MKLIAMYTDDDDEDGHIVHGHTLTYGDSCGFGESGVLVNLCKNMISGILESSPFKKYGICWVFLPFHDI